MVTNLCDCKSKLRLIEFKTYEQVTRINNDGKLSKRKEKPYLSHVQLTDYNGENSFLQCPNCENRYEFMGIDDDGKVSRGEKIELHYDV